MRLLTCWRILCTPLKFENEFPIIDITWMENGGVYKTLNTGQCAHFGKLYISKLDILGNFESCERLVCEDIYYHKGMFCFQHTCQSLEARTFRVIFFKRSLTSLTVIPLIFTLYS